MKQGFFELADGRVIVGVAYNSVYATSDVPSANVANDSSILCGETPRMFLEPIVILDGGLDAAVGRYFYAHLLQEFFRALQLGEEFFRATFPEVYVKRLLPNDLGTGREVYDLARHVDPPKFW